MGYNQSTKQHMRNMLGHTPVDQDAVIKALARLPMMEYDQLRKESAQALDCRCETLDNDVQKHRSSSRTEPDSPESPFEEIRPWPCTVQGADILDEIEQTFLRYLSLPEHAAIIATLWVAHTHVFDAFVHTPRLNITAPEKRCGKTLFLDVIETLTPRALRTENVTPAVLFRLIDKHAPTLLIDEYDTFLNGNDALRGVLNAGHKRGGQHWRCTGDNHEPRGYTTFSPVVLAGIRGLTGTLKDRSIVISMSRALQGDLPERFDSRKTGHLIDLCRKLARWTGDHDGLFKASDPEMPGGIFNRTADNWRPLLAIADAAGHRWPEAARKALLACHASQDEAGGSGTVLLQDIRDILSNQNYIASDVLVAALHRMEDRQWAEYGRQKKPITPHGIARILGPYDIKPCQIKAINRKGYLRESLIDAFTRYLEPISETSKPAPTDNNDDTTQTKPTHEVVSTDDHGNSLRSIEGFEVSLCHE